MLVNVNCIYYDRNSIRCNLKNTSFLGIKFRKMCCVSHNNEKCLDRVPYERPSMKIYPQK